MGSASPRTCFFFKCCQVPRFLDSTHITRLALRGFVAWACSFEPVPSERLGERSHHYYRQSMGHPSPPRRPGGTQPTPRRSQRPSGALSPSVPTTRGPGGARAGGNQKLDPPPGPGYLSIPPAAPFRPTHAGPRLRLFFDSGPPAQLTGTGLHTPWACDRLGLTSAPDCGCPSIPGLRPS